MKKLFTLVSVFCTVFIYAQNLSTGAAINKAGKQRMLCMRMVKDYMAIGAEVKAEAALAELDEAVSSFNENYTDLQSFAKSKDVKDAIDVVGVQWNKFRIKIATQPDVDNATGVMADGNNLLMACNAVVDKIVAGSGSKAAVLPNICGKQRMLSQKMAVLFLANHWGVNYPNINKEMDETINNFEINFNMLNTSVLNTEEINSILKLQKEEWTYLKKSFEINGTNKMPASVFSGTNILLKNFDRTTVLYEKLVSN